MASVEAALAVLPRLAREWPGSLPGPLAAMCTSCRALVSEPSREHRPAYAPPTKGLIGDLEVDFSNFPGNFEALKLLLTSRFESRE